MTAGVEGAHELAPVDRLPGHHDRAVPTPGPIVTLIAAPSALTGNALVLASFSLGLGWILKTSAEMFDMLCLLGLARHQASRHAGETSAARAPTVHLHTLRGLVVAITNPKSIASFTASLLQFLDPALPSNGNC